MNERHPMVVSHSFSTKDIFYDKMDLRLLFVQCNIVWYHKRQNLEYKMLSICK